jgi:hypothetical protein
MIFGGDLERLRGRTDNSAADDDGVISAEELYLRNAFVPTALEKPGSETIEVLGANNVDVLGESTLRVPVPGESALLHADVATVGGNIGEIAVGGIKDDVLVPRGTAGEIAPVVNCELRDGAVIEPITRIACKGVPGEVRGDKCGLLTSGIDCIAGTCGDGSEL